MQQRPRVVWTEEEIVVIRQMAGKHTASEIARHLGKDDSTLRSLCKRRKILLAPRVPCHHCGREFGNRTMAHAAYCLFAPERWTAVCELLYSLSNGEMLCARAVYDAARADDLPTTKRIEQAISWADLARRLGLQPCRSHVHRHTLATPEQRRRRKDVHAEWDKPYDWAQVVDSCPFQGAEVLQGAPAVREVRVWDWRRKAYVPVGTVQVVALR